MHREALRDISSGKHGMFYQKATYNTVKISQKRKREQII
jgi:hypothetical protein